MAIFKGRSRAPIREHIHYAWIIAFATIALSFFSQAATSPSSQYVSLITKELGITRAAYMVTSSVSSVISVTFGLLYGPISKRFGQKKLLIFGMSALPVTILLNSFSHSLWVFVLTAALQGLVFAVGVSVTMSIMIKNWFVLRQGTIMGFMLASGSAGGAIFTQVAVRIVAAYGWRVSYRFSAVMLILVAIPCLLIIKERPEKLGLEPFGAEQLRGVTIARDTARDQSGLSFKEAIKTSRFWLGAVGFFMLGTCAHPILGNLPAYITDSGFDATYAGLASGIALISAAACKVLLGPVYDRKGIVPLILICFAGGSVSALLFSTVLSKLTIVVVPAFLGAALCGVTMVPLLYAAAAMGQKEYATFCGIFTALIPAGSAIGNPALGAAYDLTGSYRPALLIMAVLSGVALLLVLLSLRGKRYFEPGSSK